MHDHRLMIKLSSNSVDMAPKYVCFWEGIVENLAFFASSSVNFLLALVGTYIHFHTLIFLVLFSIKNNISYQDGVSSTLVWATHYTLACQRVNSLSIMPSRFFACQMYLVLFLCRVSSLLYIGIQKSDHLDRPSRLSKKQV